MHPFARPCRSHSPPWLHYPLLFPLLSFPFKFNNLPAVCFSRDSLAAPLAQRQTAESVGSLTQHKLRCEAAVSESVGCIYPDRASVEIEGGLLHLCNLEAVLNASVMGATLLWELLRSCGKGSTDSVGSNGAKRCTLRTLNKRHLQLSKWR